MRIVWFLTFTLFVSQRTFSQEIAFTFDDAPVEDGAIFTASQRTSRIIETLKKFQVKKVAFYVVTSKINNEGLKRLKSYSNAGHLIGNHSHSHRWISEMGTTGYIKDIQKADSILNATNLPYYRTYRYPFLNEGVTVGSRDSIRSALAKLHLKNAYITVDNYDWYINGATKKAVADNARINYNELRRFYIEHIWQSILFYDDIARRVIGRSPKHVLLLHENDLAALFLGDLLQFLKNKGWKIISPKEAYDDPIGEEIPNVLFNEQGRVGAIAFSKGLMPEVLTQKSEDEKFLADLLKERRIFE